MSVAAMVDAGRATAVGRHAAVAGGNPVTFHLPARDLAPFSTGDFDRVDGMRIEATIRPRRAHSLI